MDGKHIRRTILLEDNSIIGQLNINRSNTLLQEIEPVINKIERIKKGVKQFYFEVILSTVKCPLCNGRLEMVGQSECACLCGNTLDPTIEFQISPCCSARLIRKTFHYACSSCNNSVPSRFLFDERVFDAQYFREMMQESRQRKKAKREEIRRLLAESRSDVFVFTEEPDLESIPGLVYDLDEFIYNEDLGLNTAVYDQGNIFDIEKYRSHILSILGWDPVPFSDITSLEDNRRKDRAYRFITLIYMQHDLEIEIKQQGVELFVQRIYHETHIEG